MPPPRSGTPVDRCIINEKLSSDAPKLQDVVPADLELFVSRSVPIASVAQMEHNEELQQMKLPWWKRLEEDDPEMIDPYDLNKVF